MEIEYPEHPIDTGRLNILRALCRSDKGMNLGCGRTRFKYKINVDITRERTNADIILDARKLALMFKVESMPEIVMGDCLEHIPSEDRVRVLKQCWYLLKDGGRLIISVPYKNKLGILLDPVWWIEGHDHFSFADIWSLLYSVGFYPSNIRRFTAGKFPFGVVTLTYALSWLLRRKRADLFGGIVTRAYGGDIGNKGATLYAIATK